MIIQVYSYYKEFSDRGDQLHVEWNALFESYKNKYPDLAAELQRRMDGTLPSNWSQLLPTYTPNDPAVATRKLSEVVLNKIAPMLPELMGGSADLTGSNLTRWKSAVDFQNVLYLITLRIILDWVLTLEDIFGLECVSMQWLRYVMVFPHMEELYHLVLHFSILLGNLYSCTF